MSGRVVLRNVEEIVIVLINVKERRIQRIIEGLGGHGRRCAIDAYGSIRYLQMYVNPGAVEDTSDQGARITICPICQAF